METLDLTKEGVVLKRATKRHASALGRIMRPSDVEEVKASGGFLPEVAVRLSINRSLEAWAAYSRDGKLLCVFGVCHPQVILGVELHIAWMLGSVHIAEHRRDFWSASKKIVNLLRGKYRFLTNMVQGTNTVSLRWLKRLGFVFAPLEQWGIENRLFTRATLYTPKIEVENHV